MGVVSCFLMKSDVTGKHVGIGLEFSPERSEDTVFHLSFIPFVPPGIDGEGDEYADDNEQAFGEPASFAVGHVRSIIRKQAAE